MLYQRDALQPFRVMRQEDNYITNEQAREIEQKKSPQALDQAWNQLARNRPR